MIISYLGNVLRHILFQYKAAFVAVFLMIVLLVSVPVSFLKYCIKLYKITLQLKYVRLLFMPNLMLFYLFLYLAYSVKVSPVFLLYFNFLWNLRLPGQHTCISGVLIANEGLCINWKEFCSISRESRNVK